MQQNGLWIIHNDLLVNLMFMIIVLFSFVCGLSTLGILALH